MAIARRIWILLSAAIVYLIDSSLTLHGQSPDYWAGDYAAALEGNPLVHPILAWHPLAFVAAAAIWFASLSAVILFWRHSAAVWLAVAIAFDHAVGGATWIARPGGFWWITAGLYLWVAAELVAGCLRRSRGYNTRMTPPKKRRWLWFFIPTVVLALAATATLAIYNLKQQLKLEQLETAMKQWREVGPPNYLLVYTAKKVSNTGEMIDHYVVKVKRGKAVEVLVNGLPLEERQLEYYNMARLHDQVDRFLEIDAKPGSPKTYTRATFHPINGALLWYVRRVMGTRQRVEIIVESLVAN